MRICSSGHVLKSPSFAVLNSGLLVNETNSCFFWTLDAYPLDHHCIYYSEWNVTLVFRDLYCLPFWIQIYFNFCNAILEYPIYSVFIEIICISLQNTLIFCIHQLVPEEKLSRICTRYKKILVTKALNIYVENSRNAVYDFF